jgi:penicillin amidase
MKILKFVVSSTFTIALIFFLNGNLSIPGIDLPPFAKILNPVSGLWDNTVKDHDFLDYTLTNCGVNSQVKIIYDQRKVPHIYAESLQDAMYAQGYVVAKDRTFQLEFLQRFASGNLSEVLGEKTLSVDREQRRKGLDYAAERAAEVWPTMPHYNLIEAYVSGIKKGMKEVIKNDLPIEFKLLGIEDTDWSLLGSARIMKWMSDVLCGRSSDIAKTNLVSILGQDRFDFLYPEKPKNVDPVIPAEKKYTFDSIYLADSEPGYERKQLYKLLETKFEPLGIGSNNWAVAAQKSSTGNPIYSSDPHLQLTLPSVWYELSIHTPEINAYGVTIPGLPGIMMGFNDSIAWGETNVAWDVKDYFAINWVDKENLIYDLDGKQVRADIRIETIKIKGQATFYDTVIYTRWGPIQYEDHDLALRWLPHDVPTTPEYYSFIGTLTANNYNEFLSNTASFITPAQNFGFASRSGDIGLRVNGKFPALKNEDGKFIQDGTNTENDWQNYIPRIQNPQILNPERNFISSANQRSTDDSYPYFYTGRFEHYRNRTLNEILSKEKTFSPQDMMQIQASSYSKKAAEIAPILITGLKNEQEINSDNEYIKSLDNWDYNYTRDSEIATFFEMLYTKIRDKTFDEFYNLSDSLSIIYPEEWLLNQLISEYPGDPLFDIQETEFVENSADILRISFLETIQEYEDLDPSKKAWGPHRALDINHLARIPAFSSLDMSVDGHPDALNAVGSTYGPSWRMIVSLDKEIKAYGVFPGGQSGNPLSKFYKTSLDKWASKEYHELILQHKPENIKTPLYTVTIE